MNFKICSPMRWMAIVASILTVSLAVFFGLNQNNDKREFQATDHVSLVEGEPSPSYPQDRKKPHNEKNGHEAAATNAELIRVFLKHGLVSDGLSALKDFRNSDGPESWSEGRVCWYMSLYHRVGGNNGAARAWARRAKNHGIAELGEDESTFWLQFESWERPPVIRTIKDRIATLSAQTPFRLTAESTNPNSNTRGIVNEIRKSHQSPNDEIIKESILDHVRFATWKILLGEYTAMHHDLHLATTSIDSLLDGQKHLKIIEASIEADETLEDQISTDPRLAIRLDTARVRMIALKQKEELSRKNERTRLEQLRQIAKTYRDLNEEMIRWQTYHALEDIDKTRDSAKSALRQLNAIFAVVNERKDYHLFNSEPPVDGKPGDDFKILETQPVPFTTDPLSMLKALQGLAFYNLIRDQAKPEPQILRSAEKWANAAISDQNQLNVPKGDDPNNLIAHLVLGLIADMRGENLALSDNAEDRNEADDYFAEAKKLFGTFLKTLRAKNYNDSTRLFEVTEQKLDNLNDPQRLIDLAREKADTNQPELARSALETATKRHKDSSIALESIEIGHRAGMPLDELEKELNRYARISVIDADSPEAQLMLAKIRNLRAGQALGQPDDANKKQSIQELLLSRKTLAKLSEDRNLPDNTRMAIKANLALAFAYGWALGDPNGDGTVVNQSDIEATHRHAQDAIAVFTKRLDGKDPEGDTIDELRMREAMVAARIAAGHLYYMHLAEHRDESKLEFHAAADEAGRLNNAPPVLPLIGSPLLRQVFAQSADGGIKLANQERQRRRMITLWLEAMYTDQFGASTAAAAQMQKAENLAFSDGGNPEENMSKVDAAQLAAAADGFDAKVTLPDTCRAFTVLTLLKSNANNLALVKAVKLASKGVLTPGDAKDLTAEDLDTSGKSVNSPLVAFTLAKAIESYAASIPIEEQFDRRQRLIDSAKNTYKRGIALLQPERVATRYPHISAIMERAIKRLTDPKPFIDEANMLASERRFSEAIEIAKEGLVRHPKIDELWQEYFNASIELIKYDPAAAAGNLADLYRQVETVSNAGLLSRFQSKYFEATLLEAQGKLKKARKSFLSASQFATDKTGKIQSTANAARLLAAISTNP